MSLDLAWRFCPACGASSAVTREASSRAEAIASMRPAAPVLSDEQRLIGALMVGGAVALAEVSELQPEQFSDPGCGGVLRALRNVAARRMPTDAYNVWDEYSAYRIRWATIGGRENLERWARSGPQTVSQAVRLVGELGAQTRATGAARLAAEAQERERFRSAMASSRT